jgi:endonuclease/exonuclease/phosphatase family metal-dependent hydrolase
VKLIVRGCALLIILVHESCFTIRVYEKTDEPVFVSNEIRQNKSQRNDTLTVMTFNVQYSRKVDLAVSELKGFILTTPIDILLLQEMDSSSAAFIAKQLDMNYAYIPIVYNRIQKKDVGNAILAKGQISNCYKLILPNKKWINNRRRHATVADVQMNDSKVLVFSVHTETSSMSRKKRMEQVDAIINHAKLQAEKYQHVVIGGDFNTAFEKDLSEVRMKFKNAGYNYVTSEVGATATAFFGLKKPSEDHIFSRGLKYISAGKIAESKSSDHLPVYGMFLMSGE